MKKKDLYGITGPDIAPVPVYKNRLGGFPGQPRTRWIAIHNGTAEKTYSVDTLRFMESSSGLPEATRYMARQALQEFGLLKEDKKPEKEETGRGLTIATVEGIKVYQTIGGRFLTMIRGKRIRKNSLSEIEREIKGGS